jgi:hypothetical protein
MKKEDFDQKRIMTKISQEIEKKQNKSKKCRHDNDLILKRKKLKLSKTQKKFKKSRCCRREKEHLINLEELIFEKIN